MNKLTIGAALALALATASSAEGVKPQARQTTSFTGSSIAQVEGTVKAHYRTCELRNGVPHILVKRGHDRDIAVKQCMTALGQ